MLRKPKYKSSIKEFQTKCKEISNRFGINDTMAGCFICNYGKDSDICIDCSRKDECFNIAEQINKMESN